MIHCPYCHGWEVRDQAIGVMPGVWIAGNVADIQAQVISAASQGVMAAAAINADLVAEETAAAVEAHRVGAEQRAS